MANSNNLRKSSVDARVVHLYSKEINLQPLPLDDTYYTMFAHYDAIKVFEANSDDHAVVESNPLLEAYKKSHKTNTRIQGASGQTLFVFADTQLSEPYGSGETGKIDAFWADESEPLFFMTMINIGISGFSHIHTILEKIKNCYNGKKYLVYFTFDYCDIVIFLRGDSFSECANCVFNLDYFPKSEKGNALIADSITLYSFSSCDRKISPEKLTKEQFSVYLRFGVTDLVRANEFYVNLRENSKKDHSQITLTQNLVLGRHDFGIFAQNVTLQWLLYAIDQAEKFDQLETKERKPSWFTTRILSVLIPKTEPSLLRGIIDPAPRAVPELTKYIEDQYFEFEVVYREFCKKLKFTEDNVWLRWLREASMQAISFFADPMMTDLGICLVPQFLDFYRYALQLYKKEFALLRYRDNVDLISQNLFINVSILVDSMNQSSRQFIQTPPFRTISFEMPPKIMAYYMTMIRSLIEALRDGIHTYGFTISPKLTYNLDVSSLALTDILDGEEFISIGIGEEQLYCMQDTTAVLLHEIAHIVGWKSRCRRKRFFCFLRAALQDLILDIAADVNNEIYSQFKELSEKDENLDDVEQIRMNLDWKNLYDFADEILNILQKNYPEFAAKEKEKESFFYMRELEKLAINLPNFIVKDGNLCQKLCDFLWMNLIQNPDLGTSKLGRCLEYITQRRDGIYNGDDRLLLAKSDNDQLCMEILERYRKGALTHEERRTTKRIEGTTRYMFNETYADLQAIELLSLSCSRYLSLFQKKDRRLPNAELLRFLTMAVIMDWHEKDLQELPHSESLRELLRHARKICSDSPEEAYRAREVLANSNINSALLAELLDYLRECKKETDCQIVEDKGGKIAEIRHIYAGLSNTNSVLQVIESLQAFTDGYRTKLLRPDTFNT